MTPTDIWLLALRTIVRGKLLLAEELYIKALALDPNNPDALHGHSLLLAAVGRLKEALAMRQRVAGAGALRARI